MATSQRQYDALVDKLLRSGRRFGFFQAVQLIHRLASKAPRVGELGPPEEEPVRFRHDPSLVFHASDVVDVKIGHSPAGVERIEMTTAFLGLVGTASPLATVFSEDVLRAESLDEKSLLSFYDLFHHRLISLFFRSWQKYRFHTAYRSDVSDKFSHRMLAFVGVDMSGAVPARGLGPVDLLALAPLAGGRTRPARTLQVVLERFLPGANISIAPFIARRVEIPPDQQCQLGRQNCTLGEDLAIGRTVADRSGRFRVVIGPVDFPTYESLMPGGSQHALLRNVVMQFSPAHTEPELEVVLDTRNAPRFRLGADPGARLGVTTNLPIRGQNAMRGRVVLSENIEDATARVLSDSGDGDAYAAL